MGHNHSFSIRKKEGKWEGIEFNKIGMLKSTALFPDALYLPHIVKKVWKPLIKWQIWFSLLSLLNRKNSFLNWMNLKEKKGDILKSQMVKKEFIKLIWRGKNYKLERKRKCNKYWLLAM